MRMDYFVNLNIFDHLIGFSTIKLFHQYFNDYGVFHLGSSILVNGVLLYNLNESGRDMIILFLLSAGFAQLYFTCLFGQYVNSKVGDCCPMGILFVIWIN